MKRPKILTFICILGYISVVVTFPQVFSPAVKKLGVFVPALYGLLVAAKFIACVGIWYFKQWGVQLYLSAFFSKTLFDLTLSDIGFGFWFSLLVSIPFCIILLRFYPRMNPNL